MSEKHLEKNKEKNQLITTSILSIYLGSMIALFILLFDKIKDTDSIQSTMFLKEVGLFIILLILSIQSIIFYLRLIVKIKDTSFGNGLSIALSFVLLLLVVSAIYFGVFSLVGIGVFFICWKAGQLYYFAKEKNIGVKTIKYFQKIFIAYLFVTVISLLIGSVIDFGNFNILPQINNFSEIEKVSSLIQKYDVSEADISSIYQHLSFLKKELSSLQIQLTSIYGISLYLLVIIFLYVIYKAFLIRSITLEDMTKELEAFYSKQNNTTGSNGGNVSSSTNNGNKLLSLFVILRPFISSIAGFVAITVAYFTENSVDAFTQALLFIVVFLTSSFGFVLNDIIDINKDKFNHKDRILVNGKLSLSYAIKFVKYLSILSLVLSSIISPNVFIINFVTLSLLGVYSYINNKYGFLANIITSICSSFVLIIGMATGKFNPIILLLSFSTFFLILAREIVLDLRDIDSDTRFEKNSIPIQIGVEKSNIIVGILLSISTSILLFSCSVVGNIYYTFFLGVLFSILVWSSFFYYWRNQDSQGIKTFLLYSRISFLLIIPGLLSQVL